MDFDTFKGCIDLLLDKCGYKEMTKRTGLSKSTLYRMCEPDSNPTLENISKVLNFINYLDEENSCLNTASMTLKTFELLILNPKMIILELFAQQINNSERTVK